MNNPVRIQRKRIRGWSMPLNTIYVGRPSRWGNPFIVGKDCKTKEEAVAMYRDWLPLALNALYVKRDIKTLHGKNLACWCKLDEPCHADVLLELVNASNTESQDDD